MRCPDKSSVQRSLKKTGSSGEKTWQNISNSISVALTIIAPNMISKEFLGPAKRAWKTVRAPMKAWVLHIQLTEDRCFGKRSFEPMVFANFSDLWGFLDYLTIFRLFDNFLTDLPTAPLLPPSTSSYLTIILAALVDESWMRSSWGSRWMFIIMTFLITAITSNPDSALPGSCY